MSRRINCRHKKYRQIKNKPKFIFINQKNAYKRYFRKKYKKSEYITNRMYVKKYKKGGSPTTGFISFHYFRNKFPNAIINLIGFTFKFVWYKHSENYERNYINKNKNNNVNIISNVNDIIKLYKEKTI